jgi:hypothetical protein
MKGIRIMAELTIALDGESLTECCALCGKGTSPCTGPRLVRADNHERVCRDCGRRHAPPLAALIDLAQVARRVGRIGRHTLVPPLHALLDLARAAEHYTDAVPRECRQAA